MLRYYQLPLMYNSWLVSDQRNDTMNNPVTSDSQY